MYPICYPVALESPTVHHLGILYKLIDGGVSTPGIQVLEPVDILRGFSFVQ
jgi:hypothetical protein